MSISDLAQYFEISEKKARICLNIAGIILIGLSTVLFGALIYTLIS